MKITVAVVATVLAAGSAAAQTHSRIDAEGNFIERFTGAPASIVTPPKQRIDPYLVPPGWTPIQKAVIKPAEPTPGWHRKITLHYENGGHLGEHWDRFKLYADRNDEVELLGPCYSACTFVMSLLTRDRICFGEKASLHFHMARYSDGPYKGKPAYAATHLMYQSYPDDIRAWLDRKGGEKEMPFNEYWTLLATDLWKMGYRKCTPG